MLKATKEEIMTLMQELKQNGFTDEELAVKLGKTSHCIWSWRTGKSRPNFCEQEFLKKLLTKEEKVIQ